ncbi:gamma-aminobutyric acid receptor subunit epsilon [Carlito syrichta]|uniref:Gamma-aminobutyric acid receptor subunit epsilon n=1 Tax=Carlito syrichta TaxID=1868482 RepID=A0A3Q0E992_CARSF|nr:gamma-aminobutyric acid receptor subunit epsilon [Carlito syrichta]
MAVALGVEPCCFEESQTVPEGESPAYEFIYGPKAQPFSEATKPTATETEIETERKPSKLAEASRILDTILNEYDHKLRPGIGERPTEVTVEISVNSLGPLSFLDMEYTIDIILCQSWYDERLRYNDTFESLVLNGNMVSQLWIPDTFFRNSKRTQEYTITMPNQMIRIYKDGRVLYTIRMTIDAGCSFQIFKFPMDSHSCPLSFSSFSYTVNELVYKWEDFNLEINEKNSWKLFQFDFTGVSNKTENISTPNGEYMVMTLFFNVSRRFGYFALQNYVPSSVTTMLSWVSFWIKTEYASARTSLGFTSVLTMTTLGSYSCKEFPRASFITALDFYIAICFIFCFCALMEFAVLNYVTYNRRKPPRSPILRYPPIDSGTHSRALARARARARARQQEEIFVCEIVTTEGDDGEERVSCSIQWSPSLDSLQDVLNRLARMDCSEGVEGFRKYYCLVPDCQGSTWQQGHLCFHVSRLDNYSRVAFPVTFFLFNVIYWLVCFNM